MKRYEHVADHHMLLLSSGLSLGVVIQVSMNPLIGLFALNYIFCRQAASLHQPAV